MFARFLVNVETRRSLARPMKLGSELLFITLSSSVWTQETFSSYLILFMFTFSQKEPTDVLTFSDYLLIYKFSLLVLSVSTTHTNEKHCSL